MNEPKPLENHMTNAELADEIEKLSKAFDALASHKGGKIEDRAVAAAKLEATLMVNRDEIIAALRQSSDKVLVTESMVEAAAKWLSESPLIHEPKLPPPAWMGLARHVLQKALSAAEAEGHHE